MTEDSDAHLEAVSERDAEMDQFEVESFIYQMNCALWFLAPPNTPFPRFGDTSPLRLSTPPNP
jgi:hypothetical protein